MNFIESGYNYIKEGKYDKAIIEFKVAAYGGSSEVRVLAYNLLSQIYKEMGNQELSNAYLIKANEYLVKANEENAIDKLFNNFNIGFGRRTRKSSRKSSRKNNRKRSHKGTRKNSRRKI
jgi:tetratricopeptide (TPR) repeat protein